MRKLLVLAAVVVSSLVSLVSAPSADAHVITCTYHNVQPFVSPQGVGGGGITGCSGVADFITITVCLDKWSSLTGWQQVICSTSSRWTTWSHEHVVKNGGCVYQSGTKPWRTRLMSKVSHDGVLSNSGWKYGYQSYLHCK